MAIQKGGKEERKFTRDGDLKERDELGMIWGAVA
jgi:hypothetical protein